MLTDYVLAGVASVLARGLVRAGDSRATRSWALAFLAAAASALVGGSVHGFGFAMPPPLQQALRVGTVMGVGVVGTSLLAGVVFASVRPGPVRRWLLGLCAAKLAFYLAWVAYHPQFRYAAYDSLPSVLLVLGFLVRWRGRGGPPEATQGAAGLGLSIAGAVLQQAGLGVHPVWFNHNDLYHVIQAAALVLIARAGRRLRDAA
jgi:hypothetical protein